MRSQGWYDRSGVKILEGKWQDFINSQELLDVGGFDIIYTDTFSEDYQGEYDVGVSKVAFSIKSALRTFFEHIPDLLAGPESRFSFFNGLGATSEVSCNSRPIYRCS